MRHSNLSATRLVQVPRKYWATKQQILVFYVKYRRRHVPRARGLQVRMYSQKMQKYNPLYNSEKVYIHYLFANLFSWRDGGRKSTLRDNQAQQTNQSSSHNKNQNSAAVTTLRATKTVLSL